VNLTPVADAQALIVSGIGPLSAESVSIFEATGRILAEALKARLTQPPFPASAMDGYAVRADDLAVLPTRLKIVGVSAAGHGFGGEVGSGEAARIFTGAPVPSGADTVVIQENTKVIDKDEVEILEGARLGQNIRPRGNDFAEGEVLLAAGTKLGARQLMLAASMNHASLAVRRKPVVAVLANGDELVEPGSALGPGQIVSSIPAGVKAAIEAWGGEAIMPPIARDDRESLAASIASVAAADVLLTIGGASVGEHDLVRGVLEGRGAEFQVVKAAMRPGKPVMFGFLGPQRVLSLPGNPASALICARVFLNPLLEALLGLPRSEDRRLAPLAVAVGANGDREHYMRATLTEEGVRPIREQDSSLVTAFAQADCLLVRPAKAPPSLKGALAQIIPLDF
jgi:molybdopterin molybdotransferase